MKADDRRAEPRFGFRLHRCLQPNRKSPRDRASHCCRRIDRDFRIAADRFEQDWRRRAAQALLDRVEGLIFQGEALQRAVALGLGVRDLILGPWHRWQLTR